MKQQSSDDVSTSRITRKTDLLLRNAEMIDEIMERSERFDDLRGVRVLRSEFVVDEEDAELDLADGVHFFDELEPEDLRTSSRVERESSSVYEEEHDFVFRSYAMIGRDVSVAASRKP